MKELKERTAVVTGAASGIGRAMASSFLDAGMNVVLADIEADRLQEAEKSFKKSGGNVLGVHLDVSKLEQVQALAKKTLDHFGAVHVLCNNAGIGYPARSSWEAPVEVWEWTLNVNLMGVVHGIQTFMPIMLDQDTDAHVVNTASITGLIMNTYSVPYAVSKHGVVALSESLFLELLNRQAKVKVSVLCPGPVNTDIINAAQRFRPDSVPPPPKMTPEEALFKRAFEIYLERGMDPKEVARQVLDAIVAERFYVIPHDFSSSIEQRMKNVLTSKNPEIQPPPQEILDIYEELMSASNGDD
jgi:NAD(P)-dependent dehydrogenase (short-subunit alcohol dehydrogenase family)